MTAAELKNRCENRNFDRIVVVVRDIFKAMANMQRINKALPGGVRLCTEKTEALLDANGRTIPYAEKQASYYYSNTELCFVEPGAGDTLYRRFLDRYGEGICCVRERVAPDALEGLERAYAEKGLPAAQRAEYGGLRGFWLDLTAELGILFQVIAGNSGDFPAVTPMPDRISQVNITTPDLQKTIETLAKLLEIGPWEVGRQCNAVVRDSAFRVDGALREADFSFLLGILVCGNIEWEVIQPEKGPLVYYDFLSRRALGFHHVLQEIPKAKWGERLAQYASDGIPMALKGSLGPVDFCYMDTEQALGFYTELRTDAVMDRLPDGYVQYFYPEN